MFQIHAKGGFQFIQEGCVDDHAKIGFSLKYVEYHNDYEKKNPDNNWNTYF